MQALQGLFVLVRVDDGTVVVQGILSQAVSHVRMINDKKTCLEILSMHCAPGRRPTHPPTPTHLFFLFCVLPLVCVFCGECEYHQGAGRPAVVGFIQGTVRA